MGEGLRRTARRTAMRAGTMALGLLGPASAWAMAKCPPESHKSDAFMALGWGLLLWFVAAGLALPVLAVLKTRGRRLRARVAWFLAACVAMLVLWLLGLWVFLVGFALQC